jgi:hypothetical protein
MKTRTITVNIRQQPELHEALMYAMNSGTDYNGWHVMQYSEFRGREGQMVAEFTLRDAMPPSS